MAKLYIICGHGAGDSGAVGNGYKEAERVRALAARIKALGGSDVVVLDTSVNWYATKGLNSLKVPAGTCVLELHLDSAAAKGARGGHVIIKKGLAADSYDKALAKFISGYFAGRSVTISQRSDLQNVNIAARRGINYRLLETCFISNAADIKKLNENMDEVAAGILAAFGIKAGAQPAAKAEKPVAAKPAGKSIDQLAREVINGDWGNGTTRKKRLTAAGYDYAKVQARVNEMLR